MPTTSAGPAASPTASSWPTATAQDASGSRNLTANRTPGHKAKLGVTLTDAIRLWSTPLVTDAKDLAENRTSLQLLGSARILAGSLPGPTISTDGETYSPSDRILNPRFVEALMGWPAGWTWPFALTDSEHAEMVSCRPRPRGPSASSGPDFEEDR